MGLNCCMLLETFPPPNFFQLNKGKRPESNESNLFWIARMAVQSTLSPPPPALQYGWKNPTVNVVPPSLRWGRRVLARCCTQNRSTSKTRANTPMKKMPDSIKRLATCDTTLKNKIGSNNKTDKSKCMLKKVFIKGPVKDMECRCPSATLFTCLNIINE